MNEKKGADMVCVNCGHDTRTSLSPDLDISGVAVCDECKEQVESDLYVAIMHDTDESWKWFENKYDIRPNVKDQ